MDLRHLPPIVVWIQYALITPSRSPPCAKTPSAELSHPSYELQSFSSQITVKSQSNRSRFQVKILIGWRNSNLLCGRVRHDKLDHTISQTCASLSISARFPCRDIESSRNQNVDLSLFTVAIPTVKARSFFANLIVNFCSQLPRQLTSYSVVLSIRHIPFPVVVVFSLQHIALFDQSGHVGMRAGERYEHGRIA